MSVLDDLAKAGPDEGACLYMMVDGERRRYVDGNTHDRLMAWYSAKLQEVYRILGENIDVETWNEWERRAA